MAVVLKQLQAAAAVPVVAVVVLIVEQVDLEQLTLDLVVVVCMQALVILAAVDLALSLFVTLDRSAEPGAL